MPIKCNSFFAQFLAAHHSSSRATGGAPEASVTLSLSPSPHLREFLDDLSPDMKLDWSDQSYQGLPALRENVLGRYGYAPACQVDDVLITAGAQEANFLAMAQLLSPGDELIVAVPGWPQPIAMAAALGVVVKRWPRLEGQKWSLDLDALTRLISSRTRMIFICNPSNPTGHVTHAETLLEVVAMADMVGAYVLCDEVYRGLEWDGQETPRMATLYERGISTGSVSKLLGLQGLRTGWLISRDRQLIADAMVLRENTSEIMNVMGEAIAEIALRPERFAAAVQRSRETGGQRMDRLDDFVTRAPGLTWHRPPAGLLGLARLDLPLTGDALAAKLLGPPYRTFIMSGSAYESPQHVRLGVGGVSLPELEDGLQRMNSLLSSLAA